MKLFATIADKSFYSTNKVWETAMNNLRGKEVEIDTTYLFLNQLNTIQGVGTEQGLRIMFGDISTLRIENGTLEDCKEQMRKYYKEAWKQELKAHSFSGWDWFFASPKERELKAKRMRGVSV